MARPQPIVLPGNSQGSFHETKSANLLEVLQGLKTIADLYQGTIGAEKQRQSDAEGFKALARSLGMDRLPADQSPVASIQGPSTFTAGTDDEVATREPGQSFLTNLPQPSKVDINALGDSKFGQQLIAKRYEQANKPEEYGAVNTDAGVVTYGKQGSGARLTYPVQKQGKFPTATITKDGPDGKPHIYAQDPTTGDFTRDQGVIGDKSFKYTGASVFRGEDDNWWRWNPSSGDPEYYGRTASGKYGWINDPNKSVPDAIPKEKGRTPAGLMDKGVQIDTIRGNIARVRATKKDAWIGPVAGRAYRVQEALTGLKDDDQSMFYADVNDLGDMLLRARSGAQINEQEYARLRKLVPTPDLPPKTFNERLDRFETQLMQILENQEKRLGAGRYLVPSTQKAPEAAAPARKEQSDPLRIR